MRRHSFVFGLVGVLIASAPAFAQRTTGDIVGTVTDDTGAVLPSVTVTLVGEGAIGTFTATTSASGFYRFNRLYPGAYNLSFAMDGFAPANRTAVRVSVGATTEENVSLGLGAMIEAVTVSAASVVDATDTGMSNNFDNQMVANLPLRRSSVYDLMLAAPGVTSAGEGGTFVGHFLMAMGSETDGNSFQLDGVSVNSRSQGRVWLSPNTDIIDEVEIIALGAPAEYGHAPGGVFNVVTKQGTNSFHGDVGFYSRTDGLTGRNTDEEYDNGHPYHVDHFHDFTAQLGGPIVKNKLWFFSSYQNRRSSATGAGVPAEFVNTNKNWTILGKINWQINPSHQIVAKYAQDNYSWGSANDANSSPSFLAREYGRTPVPSISYTGSLSSRTMLEVRAGGFFGRDHWGPQDPDQRKDQPVYYNYAHGGDCSKGPCLFTGGPLYWYDFSETSRSINVSLSHYADDFLGGSHDFKFGVQYERAGREDAIVGYNDYFTLYQDDNGYQYVFGYDYTPFAYGGIANNRSVFFDDTWRVNDRLTLKLGARYDHDWASVPEFPTLDAFGNKTGGVASPKVDKLFGFDSFSPRLGLTYKLTKDGRTLFRAGFGRYSRGIVTMDFAGGVGNIATTDVATFTGYYDPAGFDGMTLQGDGRGDNVGGAANNRMDPNISATYTDQYVLGLERELSRNFGLALVYTHKRGNNFPSWREVAGKYEQFEYVDETTGIPLTLSRLLSDPEGRVFVLGNPDFMDTRVDAFAATLTKRMSSHWQLSSSLQLMRSTGSLASGKTQNDWGRQDGGVAWRPFGKSPNDFVNLDGRLIGDVPVTFKTQVFAELPKGFLVGANYIYQQAGVWARTTRVQVEGLGRENILLEPKDGSRRWDTRSTMDLRLQWTGKLGQYTSVSLFADGYNIFNDNAGQGVQSTGVNSDVLGKPSNIILPRRLQLGAKLQF